MIGDRLSPEEQSVIQRIHAASKPKLDAAAREAIRQRVVTEFRAVSAAGQPYTRTVRPHFAVQPMIILVTVVVIVIVIGLVIIQSRNQNINPTVEPPTITVSPESLAATVPSQTSAFSGAEKTSTAVVTPVPSLTPELVPTSTPTIPPTAQLTPSSTPLSPPSTEEVVVILEGPVTSITDNIVTIYDFNVEVGPQHPILQVIDVGDIVRIQGILDSGSAVVAAVVSNIPGTTSISDNGATVGLDGPVEAVNGNIITVNSIPVQLAPDDPLLKTVQVGNFVSVQGNFQSIGSTVVLVVVNIVVVNNAAVQTNCWYHIDAMGMGHWHCDGMGMGMGDAMGMGDDGMGMGDAMGMSEAMGMGK